MSSPNALAYGFHGTTVERADEIIATGYESSRGDGHWLGPDLIYFYEDPQLATGWASHWAVRNFGGKPALVRSTIDLSQCLDLTQSRYKELVSNVAGAALNRLPAARIEAMRQNHGLRELDSFVLGQVLAFAKASGDPFTTVRAICSARNGPQPERIFPSDGPIFSTEDMQSWFDHHDHIQIGVADAVAIGDTVRVL